VYVPVFDREIGTGLWPGNLKKYKINENGVLLDADNNPALDNTTKALLDEAKDLWATTDSTDAIRSGGAANKIVPGVNRKVYTDNGTDEILITTNIPNIDFGLTDSTEDTNLKADLVTFIRGTDPSDNSARNHMGDIIHSKPVQLSYNPLDEDDVTNGTEAYAYMPRELLKNINKQYSQSATDHIYGVDGPITLWLDESNSSPLKVGNGILDSGWFKKRR